MILEVDEIVIEERCGQSALAARVISRAPAAVPVNFIADARDAIRPTASAADPFGAGKRRMAVMHRRAPFLLACPAGSSEFACCGDMVLALASNSPMDCGSGFLQQHFAVNADFQLTADHATPFSQPERPR